MFSGYELANEVANITESMAFLMKKHSLCNLTMYFLKYKCMKTLYFYMKVKWLFDYKGKRYLDMFGGIATVSVGHCHLRITEAIAEQSGILGHVSGAYEHPKMYEYVESLVSKMPGNLKLG